MTHNMRPAILVCTLLSAACALPPRPPPLCAPAPCQDSPQDVRLDSTERSESEEREREAIRAIFDALKDMSPPSDGDADPALDLLEKLQDIALASVADRQLTREERNDKYTPAVFDVMEEFARTTITDNKERDTFLAIIQLSRNAAKGQSSNTTPDKAAFLSAIAHLFDEANEPFPGGSWGLDELQDRATQERDKQNFLAVLDAALDDINM